MSSEYNRSSSYCGTDRSSASRQCDGPIMLSSLPSCAIPLRPESNEYAPSYQGGCYTECNHHGGCRPGNRGDASNFSFQVLITPVSDLRPTSGSDTRTLVEFRIRRYNQTVTLQWEPFEGSMANSGVAYLSVHQTIPSLPNHVVTLPYLLSYRGNNKISFLELDPNTRESLKFYLDVTGSGSGVVSSDHFYIPGGSVTWITDG